MSENFEFEAQVRTDLGKAASRRLRRLEDKVPAVIYGAGKEPQTISLLHKRVLQALSHEAVYSHILTIKLDGKSEKVVLKDMMRHPFKPKVMHMDFLRVSTKEKLTMNVPVHFINEEAAPGVKAGGVVSKLETELQVSCLPANLPEFIELDMGAMEIGDTLHLLDVKLPKGVELLHPVEDEEHNHAVVSIHMAKQSTSEESEEEVSASESGEEETPAAE